MILQRQLFALHGSNSVLGVQRIWIMKENDHLFFRAKFLDTKIIFQILLKSILRILGIWTGRSIISMLMDSLLLLKLPDVMPVWFGLSTTNGQIPIHAISSIFLRDIRHIMSS